MKAQINIPKGKESAKDSAGGERAKTVRITPTVGGESPQAATNAPLKPLEEIE